MGLPDNITCNVIARLSVTEEIDDADMPGASTAAEREVKHSAYDLVTKLVKGTTPDPDAVFSKQYTASATIDLTAAPKSGGSTQDLTGKKLIAYILEAPTTNAATATLDKGASNGYEINGPDQIDIEPGQTILTSYVSGKATVHPAVAAGAKNLDLTLSGTDDLNITMVFGGA